MLSVFVISSYANLVQSTTEDAAQDIAAFIALFFQHFTKYQGAPLHMAGESYGVCDISRLPELLRSHHSGMHLGPVSSTVRSSCIRPERCTRGERDEPG